MTCAEYFADTGFLDLWPLAQEVAQDGDYSEQEMIEAICMTFDKAQDYPPTKNRCKWFLIVFTEKLAEVRAQTIRLEWSNRRRHAR